jgi:hypothetical protein
MSSTPRPRGTTTRALALRLRPSAIVFFTALLLLLQLAPSEEVKLQVTLEEVDDVDAPFGDDDAGEGGGV